MGRATENAWGISLDDATLPESETRITDFAAFLAETPRDERSGPVFAPEAVRRHEGPRSTSGAGIKKTVAALGVTDMQMDGGGTTPAAAHAACAGHLSLRAL